MRIGIPKEVHSGEKRVATTPEAAKWLQKLGFSVCIEAGAGNAAKYLDSDYLDAGVEVLPTAQEIWSGSDIVLKVRPPQLVPDTESHEMDLLSEGQTLITFFWPAQNSEALQQLADKKINMMAMDCVPRISRSQKLDALSSMANIAGYRGVIEAAHHFGRFFTGQITAAGKVPPAITMVIGAGVAGLAAIGAANGLGSIVRAFDTRLEVKEQIESVGAEFLELEFEEDGSGEGGYAKTMSDEFIAKEMELFAQQCLEVDIIVTTALIPGKPAPKLITEEMVKTMKQGSVIVDLAAEQGGNCELTEPDQVVVRYGVTIIGYTNLPSRLATQASQLYSTNIRHLLTELTPEKDGVIDINMDDEVIRGTTVIKQGEVTWPPPAPTLTVAPKKPVQAAAPVVEVEEPKANGWKQLIAVGLGALLLYSIGKHAPEAFMQHFTVFVLACFIGYQVIWNVAPALHTPLMSVTNAISGIIIIGAIVQVSSTGWLIPVLSGIAILIATINVVGGFMVTRRMLKMFEQ